MRLQLVAVVTLTAMTTCALAQNPEVDSKEAADAEVDEVDELIAEMLTAEGDEDLQWLYDESYEPSRLGGQPISAPELPRRGQGAARRWNPAWSRFGVGNYILTGTAFAAGIGGAILPTSPGRWSGTNRFDESVRDNIGITGYADGTWARDTSDLLLSMSVAYPMLFDSLIVTYWYRASPDVAEQMVLISTESVAVATALQALTAGLASRERPYVRNCGESIDRDLDDCRGRKPYRSFFSGHTALSFTGAGLACSHHMRHDVFGDGLWDGIACASAMTAAATVGALRVVGDQHYATDVLVGAAVGTFSGVGLPWLLHYGPTARSERPAPTTLRMQVMAYPGGLGVGGVF